ETAKKELKTPERIWQGVSLLQGIKVRWPKSKVGPKAAKILEDILSDPDKAKLVAAQGGAEQERSLTAQARGWERFGLPRQAYQFWKMLSQPQPDTPAGKKAAKELKRLQEMLAKEPFLGLGLKDGTTTINYIFPKGPADRAGLKVDDTVVKMGGKEVSKPADLAQALQTHKPGNKVKIEVQRGGKVKAITVEIGRRPLEGDK